MDIPVFAIIALIILTLTGAAVLSVLLHEIANAWGRRRGEK